MNTRVCKYVHLYYIYEYIHTYLSFENIEVPLCFFFFFQINSVP